MSTKKRAAKKVPIDYQKGKIYKIVNDVNDMVYIGSTTQTLPQRFYSHKTKARTQEGPKFHQSMSEIGIDHFQILLIELFPCTCKAELEAREYALTNELPSDKRYNSKIDGKHSDESKAKMKANAFGTGKFDDANPTFNRGCISKYQHSKYSGFMYTWRENGKNRCKTFLFGTKRTKEEAYKACVDLRNQIFPLTKKEDDELPVIE